MRIDDLLLYQIQAAWHRRDAAMLRYEAARGIAADADLDWQRLLAVIENKHNVKIGIDSWIDISTGEISQIANQAIPTPAIQKEEQ